jgi:ribosomal small subunit protein bTHX
MAKGDRRTKRGKIANGSYGRRRSRKSGKKKSA